MLSRTESAAFVLKPSGLLIDLDGTLIDSNDRCSPVVTRAVKRAAKRIPVAIASGREPDEVSHFARMLGLQLPQVCDNGARLVDPLTGRSLRHSPLPEHVARGLIDSICAEGLSFYAVENGRMVRTKDGFKEWAVTIIAAKAGDERLARSIASKLASDETTTELSTNPDGTFWYVNFVLTGIDKAHGVRQFASTQGIDPRELMAVGDGLNDLSMFKMVGLPVAMGNAPEEVKRCAAFVARSLADDGLAGAIERFVL